MKFIIVGQHCSGKQEVLDLLEQWGVNCGHLFSDLDEASSEIYNSHNYELYSPQEIHTIFENNAYIFIHEIQCRACTNAYKHYEGLSFYDYDNNDVFVLSPDQIVEIPTNVNLGDVCFVWLDNTEHNREVRYRDEQRVYNFREREEVEKQDLEYFVKYICEKPVIYFTNEDPIRVATIINACLKHPDIVQDFIENFS